MNYKWLVLIVLFGSFFGCDEESRSTVVDIDIPENEPQIVFHGVLSPGMDSVDFQISNTLGVFENKAYSKMELAKVQLLKDDQPFINIVYDEVLGFKRGLEEPVSNLANTYTLEVTSEGFPTVKAEQKMPVAIPLEAVTFEPLGAITIDGRFDAFTFEFQDPAEEENFYAIEATLFYSYRNELGEVIEERNFIGLDSEDPLIESGYPNTDLMFADNSINGKRVRLKLFTFDDLVFLYDLFGDSLIGDIKVSFQLISISKDGFLYFRSLENYANTIDDPFSEPIVVYSNISSGRGVFYLESFSPLVELVIPR